MTSSQIHVDYESDFGTARKARGKAERPRRSWRRRLLRALLFITGVAVALVLPFAVLVRLSVYLYSRGLGNWAALGVAAIAVFTLLLLYVVVLRIRFQRRLSVPKLVRRGLLVVVAGYVGYALIYLSGANAKTEEIRSAYVALSPILRVATGTVLLADREAVVTDVGRTRADYVAWGLPVNEASLHFEQDDGFVHAVDLRTQGRRAWRNSTLLGYYRAMGFRTLRHVGTADHLHVSLPVR